jgi:polar amino acid transport system permease protein
MSKKFLPIETWAMIALLYLLMTLISARIVKIIEMKTKMEK